MIIYSKFKTCNNFITNEEYIETFVSIAIGKPAVKGVTHSDLIKYYSSPILSFRVIKKNKKRYILTASLITSDRKEIEVDHREVYSYKGGKTKILNSLWNMGNLNYIQNIIL